MNIAQPRPQALNNNRQLPQLPIPLRQLPQIDDANAAKPYFDTDDTENDDLMSSTQFTRAGELFYYQTSSSNSNASSVSGNFERVNRQEQFRTDLQDGDDDDQRQVEDDENDQRLRSYDDDDDNEASPYEYES